MFHVILFFQLSDDSGISRLTLRNVHVRHSTSSPLSCLQGFCYLCLLHNMDSPRVWLPCQDLRIVPAFTNSGFGRSMVIRAEIVIAPTISKFRICMFAGHKQAQLTGEKKKESDRKKKKKIKQHKNKNRMDRQNVNRQNVLYPRQMVKATLNSQEHTKKLTYSHSQKGKRRTNKKRSPKKGSNDTNKETHK